MKAGSLRTPELPQETIVTKIPTCDEATVLVNPTDSENPLSKWGFYLNERGERPNKLTIVAGVGGCAVQVAVSANFGAYHVPVVNSDYDAQMGILDDGTRYNVMGGAMDEPFLTELPTGPTYLGLVIDPKTGIITYREGVTQPQPKGETHIFDALNICLAQFRNCLDEAGYPAIKTCILKWGEEIKIRNSHHIIKVSQAEGVDTTHTTAA